MKKKKVCEKKKRCNNGLGYCPTVSQYNGKLYCDTTSLRCEVGWKLYCNLRLLGSSVLQHGAVGLQSECVTIL